MAVVDPILLTQATDRIRQLERVRNEREDLMRGQSNRRSERVQAARTSAEETRSQSTAADRLQDQQRQERLSERRRLDALDETRRNARITAENNSEDAGVRLSDVQVERVRSEAAEAYRLQTESARVEARQQAYQTEQRQSALRDQARIDRVDLSIPPPAN